MAEGSDDSEKSEEPTQRRLQEAVKKGQVAFSREVSNFLMFVVLALNIVWFAPYYMEKVAASLSRFIHSPHEIRISDSNLVTLGSETAADIMIFLAAPIIATIFAAFFSSFMQNGLVISAESIIPKLEKISIMKGLKRLFSIRSLVEFFKGLIKITLVGTVAYMAIKPQLMRLENLASYDLAEMLELLAALSFRIVLGACAIMLVVAVLDYMYQRFEYMKNLRMSKQELKEEFKQSEGDPQIKARLRQIRMERAQKRMMAGVPDADVVIRNPEHYAVALKYDEGVMPAPVVVAMGQNFMALKIIEIAEQNDIVTVRNPPLARALYSTAEIDEEIPLEHYQAVAEVISYVYKLRGQDGAKRA